MCDDQPRTSPVLWPLLVGEQAATAVEYAVLLAFILLAILVSVGLYGDRLNAMFQMITNAAW